MNRRHALAFLAGTLAGGNVMADGGPSAAAKDMFARDQRGVIGAALSFIGGDDSSQPGAHDRGYSTYVGQYFKDGSDIKFFDALTTGPRTHSERVLNAKGRWETKTVETPNTSPLDTALKNARSTGKPYAFGVSSGDSTRVRDQFEYGLLVRPDGSAQFIVREFMGPQGLSPAQANQKDAMLQQNGLLPLATRKAGYQAVFAADIDAKGNVQFYTNPDDIDLRAFGVEDKRAGHLPSEPIASPVAPGGPAPVHQQPTRSASRYTT